MVLDTSAFVGWLLMTDPESIPDCMVPDCMAGSLLEA